MNDTHFIDSPDFDNWTTYDPDVWYFNETSFQNSSEYGSMEMNMTD